MHFDPLNTQQSPRPTACKLLRPAISDARVCMASCWCDSPLALLVSGVLARFSYEHAFSLLQPHGTGRTALQQLLLSKPLGCAPAVDAFAVLQAGASSSWTGLGVVGGAGAMSKRGSPNATAKAIARHYHEKLGVRRARITLLSEAELTFLVRQTEVGVATAGAAAIATTPGRWWHAATQLHNWQARWGPHARMLSLRHAVFRSALGLPVLASPGMLGGDSGRAHTRVGRGISFDTAKGREREQGGLDHQPSPSRYRHFLCDQSLARRLHPTPNS